MSEVARFANVLAQMDPVDILLADVAVRVQLNPTDYSKAESRAGTIADWIDRPASLLHGRVGLVYPQGSMAIGATVARYSERDEFDIDLMAHLALWTGATPQSVLDVLHESIRGERGSRYWGKTERRTRCVTVFYEDGMHLDITPAERRGGMPERECDIFCAFQRSWASVPRDRGRVFQSIVGSRSMSVGMCFGRGFQKVRGWVRGQVFCGGR